MSISTFVPPIPPSPGTANKPEIKLLEAQFGDGYTQVTRDGLNHIRKILTLSWDGLVPAHAKIITDFLEARGGDESFLYTPSDEAVPIQWTCKEWDDKRTQGGLRVITATFRQNFNLQETVSGPAPGAVNFSSPQNSGLIAAIGA
jgi:phage-related protein